MWTALRETFARLVSFIRRDDRERDFDEEVVSHIEMATEDNVRKGLPTQEARRLALARLGGIESSKQLHRESRGLPSLDALNQDLRYAVRSLRRSPSFSLAAILTLAIGIGATTAIFSSVNATLLRPLPYPRADELVDVHTRYSDGRVTTGYVASIELESLNGLPAVVSSAAGFSMTPFDATLIQADGAPIGMVGNSVSRGFFELFELPMALGRAFVPDEHVVLGGSNPPPRSAVLSHRAWITRFGGDPNVIGQTLQFAEFDSRVTVVGVASPAFDFPKGTDFWLNLRLIPQSPSHVWGAIARMQPGVTVSQLLSVANLALIETGRTEPANVGREYVLRSFLSSIVGDLQPVLLIVLGATLLLLVLACVNVTNLLLARGMSQGHEAALRAALGASRGRIIVQLLTQSMVLAAAGSIAGAALAYGFVRLLLLLGGSDLPRLETVPFDWRVLMFSLALLVASGLAMGIVPALRLARTDIKTVLNEGGRRTTSNRATSRIMSGMIVAEIAMAIALVAGAGWLIQSFARLRTNDPGFVAHGRLLIDVRTPRRFASPVEGDAWHRALLGHVREAAGDAVVGSAATFPLRIDRDGTTNIELADEASDPNRPRSGRMRIVAPGFFEAMGTKLIAGRTLTDDDRRGQQPVALVNRAFVRRHLADVDPVGAAFADGFPKPDRANMRLIVGVVDDVRYKSLGDEAEAAFYVPMAQVSFSVARHAVVVAPAANAPEALIPAIRAELARFDPQLDVIYTPVAKAVDDTLARQELGMTLMLVFGATALVLAAIGLYGVIAYAAAQRRTELATRVALGASGREVFWLVMGAGQRLLLIGLVLGLGLAYSGGRIVSGSVFAMRAADPLVLLTAGVMVAAVTWVATIIPAIRASRQDPLRALRSE